MQDTPETMKYFIFVYVFLLDGWLCLHSHSPPRNQAHRFTFVVRLLPPSVSSTVSLTPTISNSDVYVILTLRIPGLSDISADAIVVWDWFFGLQREWRFVRARNIRLRRVCNVVGDRVADMEDELDACQGCLSLLSVRLLFSCCYAPIA